MVSFKEKISLLKHKGEGGLMLYLPLGDPDLKRSLELAEKYVELGVDFIEIGLPTDNAFLDSDFIQSTMKRALKKEDNLNVYFSALQKFRQSHPSVPLIALVYHHIILNFGVNNFIKGVKKAGIEGVILVGKGNITEIEEKLQRSGLFVVNYLPHHMPEKELNAALRTKGFLYFQATPGSEGKHPKCKTLKNCISYIKNKGISVPIFCGIGVSTPDDVRYVIGSGADAAIVGSAVLKLRDNIEKMKNYILQLKNATKK